jgi:hypothetical protein
VCWCVQLLSLSIRGDRCISLMICRFGAELLFLFNFCIQFAVMIVVIMDLLCSCSVSTKVAAVCGSCLDVTVDESLVGAFETAQQ